MRCCAPFCRNTPDNILTLGGEGNGISFHGFPSDASVRAAWLRALGKQDAALADSAVVCSQHFLEDDICETESGLRRIDAGAIPSTVLVCTMCLDTDSKLLLMRKHKLEEAYEHLTGYAPCNVGNLKQTLCVQCAQRLMNFSRFRDRSLRARALMMDLVEKHELITRRHIKMINRIKHSLRSPLVVKTLGADFCDLHIQEDMSEDKHTESETTIDICLVKTEDDDSMAIREDMDMVYEDDDYAGNVNNEINEDYNVNNEINEDYNVNNEINEDYNVNNEINEDYNIKNEINENYNVSNDFVALDEENVSDVLKCESVDLKCSNELVQDLAYVEASVQTSLPSLSEIKPDPDSLRNGCVLHTTVDPLSAISTDSAEHLTEGADAGASSERAVSVSGDLDDQSSDNNNTTNDNIDRYTNCIVKLYDVFHKKITPKRNASSTKTRKVVTPCESEKIEAKSPKVAPLCARVAIAAAGEEHLTEGTDAGPSSERAVAIITGELDDQSSDNNNTTNDNIDRYTNRIVKLDDVFGKKPMPKRDASLAKTRKVIISCDSQKAFKQKSCKSKIQNEVSTKEYTEPATAAEQVNITTQRKTDCLNNDITKQCIRISDSTSCIEKNMYICNFCQEIFKQRSIFVKHVQKHEKVNRYTCEICQYKCKYKYLLRNHLKSHSGEKPFCCKLCDYKSTRKYRLTVHMRLHTGEKHFSCKFCEYKNADKSRITAHMRLHTGEKPFSCKLCNYKSTHKRTLAEHMRVHTGEKPFSCKLCDYKCAQENYLVVHMRRHTGEKPYLCKLCEFKTTSNSNLVAHMRVHTGEKPYLCKLCEFKTARNSSLVTHMRVHKGEKPFLCKLCAFKTAHNSSLAAHMWVHTGEKPYSCEICDYKSADKSNLIVHMSQHTDEEHFSCKL